MIEPTDAEAYAIAHFIELLRKPAASPPKTIWTGDERDYFRNMLIRAGLGDIQIGNDVIGAEGRFCAFERGELPNLRLTGKDADAACAFLQNAVEDFMEGMMLNFTDEHLAENLLHKIRESLEKAVKHGI